MKRVNIAVVAFGKIAKTHILAAYMANLKLQLPFELKVSHIITSRPEDIPFSNICVCRSLEEALITGESIDIVDICNINQAHYETAQIAIDAGKAIYCEKPLTDNLQHSFEIAKLVKEKQILHGVPLIFRYIPCLHMLKEELQQKKLGELIHFECRYYHSGYLQNDKRNTWRTKGTSGGGASIDLGIHMMDCVRFLFGEVKVENNYHNYFKDSETDEVYQANISLEGKGSGSITASRIYVQQKQMAQFEVFCERGSYLCDLTTPYSLIKNDFQGNTTIMKPTTNSHYMKYMVDECMATDYHLDAHMCCLADFARSVCQTQSGQFYANFEEAYESQKLITK